MLQKDASSVLVGSRVLCECNAEFAPSEKIVQWLCRCGRDEPVGDAKSVNNCFISWHNGRSPLQLCVCQQWASFIIVLVVIAIVPCQGVKGWRILPGEKKRERDRKREKKSNKNICAVVNLIVMLIWTSEAIKTCWGRALWREHAVAKETRG